VIDAFVQNIISDCEINISYAPANM